MRGRGVEAAMWRPRCGADLQLGPPKGVILILVRIGVGDDDGGVSAGERQAADGFFISCVTATWRAHRSEGVVRGEARGGGVGGRVVVRGVGVVRVW